MILFVKSEREKEKERCVRINNNNNNKNKIFVGAAVREGRTTGYQKKDEINPLATFHRFIGSVSAVVVMVADEALRDARFVAAAKRAVITRVVGCYSRTTNRFKR